MLIIERKKNILDKYFITPNYNANIAKEYFYKIEKLLDSGINLIQFRSKYLDNEEYTIISKKIYNICKKYNASFIINDFKNFNLNKYCDGVQLTSDNLKNLSLLNIDKQYILIGSCHCIKEIEICNNFKLDLILISPVLNTYSKNGIGWIKFKELVNKSNIPVFALGGLSYADHISIVKKNGGIGIAASSYFYNLFSSR